MLDIYYFMKIEQLLFTKKEIIISPSGRFTIPIHPRLLKENVLIDTEIAKSVFSKATEEWYEDLIRYVNSSENEFEGIFEDNNDKDRIREVFLKEKPKVENEGYRQLIDTLYWEDHVEFDENGFASSFCISRNGGGTLYFRKDDIDCKSSITIGGNAYIRFSREKCMEFNNKPEIIKSDEDLKSVPVFIYVTHNVDNFPPALFLRNWAILYLNEAMKQVLQ